MKVIMVTGAAGFIGSHLSETLIRQGYKVVGVDNFDPFYKKEIKQGNLDALQQDENFHFYELDLADANALGGIRQKVDAVVHLAAKAGVRPSIEDPTGYMRANLIATNNLLNWMVEKNMKKLVFASSSS